MNFFNQNKISSILLQLVFEFVVILTKEFGFGLCGCSVIGAILIVIGLYSVLWGKHKEEIEKKVDDIPLPIKGTQMSGNSGPVIDDTDQVKHGQVGDTNNMISSLAISMPAREPTNNVNQQ
jgi:uncharacterized membrane protein